MSGEDDGSGAASVARCMDIGCLVLFAVGGIVMLAGSDAGTIGAVVAAMLMVAGAMMGCIGNASKRVAWRARRQAAIDAQVRAAWERDRGATQPPAAPPRDDLWSLPGEGPRARPAPRPAPRPATFASDLGLSLPADPDGDPGAREGARALKKRGV